MAFSVDKKSTLNPTWRVWVMLARVVRAVFPGELLKGRLGEMCGWEFGIARRVCGLRETLGCTPCTSLYCVGLAMAY